MDNAFASKKYFLIFSERKAIGTHTEVECGPHFLWEFWYISEYDRRVSCTLYFTLQSDVNACNKSLIEITFHTFVLVTNIQICIIGVEKQVNIKQAICWMQYTLNRKASIWTCTNVTLYAYWLWWAARESYTRAFWSNTILRTHSNVYRRQWWCWWWLREEIGKLNNVCFFFVSHSVLDVQHRASKHPRIDIRMEVNCNAALLKLFAISIYIKFQKITYITGIISRPMKRSWHPYLRKI